MVDPSHGITSNNVNSLGTARQSVTSRIAVFASVAGEFGDQIIHFVEDDRDHALNFRTPMWLARSLAQIDQYQRSYLDDAHLLHPNYRSAHLWGKVKEFYRHKRWLLKLIRSSTEVRIISDWRIAGYLPFVQSRSQLNVALRPHCLSDHSKAYFEPLRLPKLMRNLSDTKADQAVREICQIASNRQLRKTALIRWLKQNRTVPHPPVTGEPSKLRQLALSQNAYQAHLCERLSRPASTSLEQVLRAETPTYFMPLAVQKQQDQIGALETWLNDPHGGHELPKSLRKLLTMRPTGVNHGLDILLAILTRHALPPSDLADLWSSPALKNWTRQIRANHLLRKPKRRIPIQRAKLALHSVVNLGTGLDQNAQMMKRALDHIIRPSMARRKEWSTRSSACLHMCNLDQMPQSILRPELIDRGDQKHIGFALWEMAGTPPSHQLGMKLLDELWVPSSFVADQYRALSPCPVHVVGKALYNLDRLADIGARIQPSKQHFTAVMIFDAHSTYARKNPLAAIHGFQTAFPAARFPEARLIIKTNKIAADHWGDPENQRKSIKEIISQDTRISLRTTWLSNQALLELIAKADVLLSPHRGEGFGYIPAYAMAMGRAVIATDWAGTRDFIRPDTGYPCAYQMTSADALLPQFAPKGAQWAEISIEDLTRNLRKVYNDPSDALMRAMQGQEAIQAQYDPLRFEANVATRLKALGILA